MKILKSWLFLIFFSLIIPVIGILASHKVSQDYEKKYENTLIINEKNKYGLDLFDHPALLEKIKLENVCHENDLDQNYINVCNQYSQIKYLGYGSWLALSIFMASVLTIFVVGKISLKNRQALFYLFHPLLLLSQFISALLVVTNSAIIIFSIYFAEAFYSGSVHMVLISFLGFAAIYGAWSVCKRALKPVKNSEIKVIGKMLSKTSYPQIWKFINSIGDQVATTPPDHIVVGMAPNFFVTETRVICSDGELNGKILYLSLPFFRLLTRPELTAIVAHEMAHFVGEDTRWSKKFFPIYRGSIETLVTIVATSSKDILVRFAFLPAIYFMNFFILSFGKAEKKISRTRELNADQVGAKITSPRIMANSLLKVHVYMHAWQQIKEKVNEALSTAEKKTVNVSSLLYSLCELIPNHFMKHEIGQSSTSHPIDSHPPLMTRLDSMGVQLSALYEEGLQLPKSDAAVELLEDAQRLEEAISLSLINQGLMSTIVCKKTFSQTQSFQTIQTQRKDPSVLIVAILFFLLFTDIAKNYHFVNSSPKQTNPVIYATQKRDTDLPYSSPNRTVPPLEVPSLAPAPLEAKEDKNIKCISKNQKTGEYTFYPCKNFS